MMKRVWMAAGLAALAVWSVQAATVVTVSPGSAKLKPNATIELVATVTGTQWTRVFWWASCGTVNSRGTYTAPSTPGTCQVRAVHWRTGMMATATMTIEAPAPAPPPPPPPSEPVPPPSEPVPAPSEPVPAPSEPVPPTAPTQEKSIWGVTNPAVLGTCTADVHDRYVVDIGKAVVFRTWHPQMDPSGCTYAHEHGDNPARMTNAEIASEPIAFGLIGWTHGHEEPHEGFKVFITIPGDRNDEGRVNRVFSRSVFHMGTGGPARFTQRFHSADIRVVHPEFGLKAFTKLMMDTGGTGVVCDPRKPAPNKDVISLQSPCKLGSAYEIWSTFQDVRNASGRVVYRAFATPAVFDPITVFNPANPSELVYAWDPRVDAIKEFTYNSWAYFRGCDRESYAQPGYWYNQGGQTTYYTDAMGMPRSADDPAALAQTVSLHNSIGAPATNDGLGAFKMRVRYCGAGLGLKN